MTPPWHDPTNPFKRLILVVSSILAPMEALLDERLQGLTHAVYVLGQAPAGSISPAWIFGDRNVGESGALQWC